jgi:hypothetical protein
MGVLEPLEPPGYATSIISSKLSVLKGQFGAGLCRSLLIKPNRYNQLPVMTAEDQTNNYN